MSQHKVDYDEDGIAINDPWSLRDYLREDNLSLVDEERVVESVASWIKEYQGAGGMGLSDLLAEVER